MLPEGTSKFGCRRFGRPGEEGQRGRQATSCRTDRARRRLDGGDLRREPLEVRKATLRSMLAKAGLGLRFNEHLEGDGPTVFAHACKMGLG
jgi:hypothetical protein